MTPSNTRAEIELLLCCARTQVDGAGIKRLRALSDRGIHWDRFRLTAFAQGVGPLVGRTLRQSCPEAVPDGVLEEWHRQARLSAKRSLLLTGRLLRLLASFRAAGLRAIPFKGPTLAAHAYQDLLLRPFVDIDVLVHKRDLPQATALLRAQAYRERWHHAWEIEFQDRAGVSVDLHWAIAPSYDPIPQTFDQLWDRVMPVTVLGVEVVTLAPEDLLSVLSVQLVKDWRESRQRLLQICDTTELLRGQPELDWKYVLGVVRAVGGERILLLDLLLAHDLLDAPVPEPVLRLAQANRTVRSLAAEFTARIFPVEGTARRVTESILPIESSALYVKARERLRDKVRYFGLRARDRIRLVVHPSESDREFLPLPSGLGFLYYLVRPVRILRKWLRTGRTSSNTQQGGAAPS